MTTTSNLTSISKGILLIASCCVLVLIGLVSWILGSGTSMGLVLVALISVVVLLVLTRRYFNRTLQIRRIAVLADLTDILVLAAYVISIILIIFIPPMTFNQLTSWPSIPFPNFIRCIAGVLLCFFFPGLFVLMLLDWKRELSAGEMVLFSLPISSIISVVVAITNFYFSPHAYLGILILGALSILNPRRRSRSDRETSTREVRVGNAILLGALCLFLVVSLWFTYSSISLFIGPDTLRHHGVVLSLLNGFHDPSAYPSFHLILAAIYLLSGFPSVNLIIVLVLLNVLIIVAFYLMANVYLKKSHPTAPVVATIIWTLFSGIGWVAAVIARVQGGTDWLSILLAVYDGSLLDIGYPLGFWVLLEGWTPKQIGFLSLFLLLYLLGNDQMSTVLRKTLLSLVTLIGLLVHFSEIFFFVICFFIMCLVWVLQGKRPPLQLIPPIFAGSCAAVVLNSSYHLLGTGSLASSFSIYTLFLPFALLVGYFIVWSLDRIVRRPLQQSWVWSLTNLKRVVLLLLYIYLMSWWIWISVFYAFRWWATMPIRFVPWYFVGVRFGIAGLLMLLIVPLGLWKNVSERHFLVFLASCVLGGLVLMRSVTLLNISSTPIPFNAQRVLTFLFPFVSMLGGFSLAVLHQRLSGITLTPPRVSNKRLLVKRVTSVSLISLIFFSGTLSVVQTVEFWTTFSQSHPESIDPAEVAALDYFREHWPTSSVNAMIAPTRTSWSVVHAFSSIQTTLQDYHLVEAMFRSRNLEMTVYLLNLIIPQPRYLYLTTRDHERFNNDTYAYAHGCFAQYILPNLPLLYNSNSVEIYELPRFSAPSPWFEAPLVILGDLRANDSSLLHHPNVVSVFCLREMEYSVLDVTDLAYQETDIVVLDEDPLNGTEPHIVALLEQANKGSSLVVFNTRGFGFFADLLNVTEAGSTDVDGVVAEGTSWQFPLGVDTISCPVYTSSASSVDALANWTIGGVAVSTLSFLYPFGNGSITYVNVRPYFGYMNALDPYNMSQRQNRAILYNSLGNFTQFIGLVNPTGSIQVPSFEIKAEEIVLEGDITLVSESFLWFNYTSRVDIYGAVGEPIHLDFFPREESTQSDLVRQRNWTIEANHVVITRHGISQYTAIEIMGSFILSQIPTRTRENSFDCVFSSTTRDNMYNLLFERGEEEMTLLLAQTPAIQVRGNSTFTGMNAAEHLISTFHPDQYYPLVTKGYLSFQVPGADQNIILSNVNFEGYVLSSSRIHWSELSLAYGYIALSIPHLLILSFIAGLAYFSLKPNQSRSSNASSRSRRTSK